jgi:hypothetical protein
VSQRVRHRILPSHRHSEEPSSHELAEARAPRPIWLPQRAEPVTLMLAGGATFPGRVLERAADMLLVAVIVEMPELSKRQLAKLVLEYANPGGRVRLNGDTTMESEPDGATVRIERPNLLEVIQERVHVRVEADLPIVVKVAAEAEAIHAHTVDLSAGGVLLGVPDVVRLGDKLTFELTLEPGTAPVTGLAEVARLDGEGRAGLRFTKLDPYEQWRLIRYTVEVQEGEGFRHVAEQGRA